MKPKEVLTQIHIRYGSLVPGCAGGGRETRLGIYVEGMCEGGECMCAFIEGSFQFR